MNKAMLLVGIIMLAMFTFGVINIASSYQTGNELDYYLLKETTEAAMTDAFDIATYNTTGNIRIDREKFVESFLRRFAQSASLANEYRIEIYDVNEYPPKVSIRIKSRKTQALAILLGGQDTFNFEIVNKLDAILETPY